MTNELCPIEISSKLIDSSTFIFFITAGVTHSTKAQKTSEAAVSAV